MFSFSGVFDWFVYFGSDLFNLLVVGYSGKRINIIIVSGHGEESDSQILFNGSVCGELINISSDFVCVL